MPERPPEARALALTAYLAWSRRAGYRRAERALRDRAADGQESPAQLDQRRGIASAARPDGPLLWIHAASTGASLALVDLIRQLLDERPDLTILVTTATVSSATVMAERLPLRTIHQFVPEDAMAFVGRFLDHWRPDLAVWADGRFAPALMTMAQDRAVPMLLVNLQLTKADHDRWRFRRGMARALLARIDRALVQDTLTEVYLRRLGLPQERIEVTGSLKEGAVALPAEPEELDAMRAAFGGRPVWLAASTHEGEEARILEAHRIALRSNPRLVLIIVPRHPERGDAIAELLEAGGWIHVQRSREAEVDRDTHVYLADTVGELGLWYRLAPISFIGGSLEPEGGHNPFEPAALGSVILHGPYLTNFVDIYQRLTAAGAARLVASPASLAEAVGDLLSPDRCATMAAAAWQVVSHGGEVTDRALEVVLDHLDRARR